MVIFDIGIIVQREDDTIAKLFLVRTQRTDKVTQSFWQHRNGTIDQIDAGGTLRSLLIDNRAFLHIVRYVGNMYTNFPKFSLFANTERIIEIFGILGVNGTGKDIAEVLATLDFLLRNTWIYLLSSIFNSLWILVGQTILC